MPRRKDYDYESAIRAGLKPDETGHWPSRVPETGKILKSPKHETFNKTIDAEVELGYDFYRKGTELYSSRKVLGGAYKPVSVERLRSKWKNR